MPRLDVAWSTSSRSTSSRRARSSALLRLTLTVAFAGLAAGCGGDEPAIGVDTIPSTIVTTTLPIVTTTTIDFNRPVDQEDTRLPAQATVADIAAVVQDMGGQTESVADQLRRLAPFPSLSSPGGSQILDFAVSVQTIADGGFRTDSMVRYRAPGEPGDLIQFIEDDLRSRGWNQAGVESATMDNADATRMIFREPGTSREEEELVVSVSRGLPVTIIELAHHSIVDQDDDNFELLTGWQSKLRLPRSAQPLEAGIVTADDQAVLRVVHRLQARTAAEAREAVVALVRPSEFQSDTSSGSGATSAPVLLTDENGEQLLLDFATIDDPDTVDMTVSTSFGLTPID